MSEPLSKWASDDRSHHDRGVEAIIRRLLGRGISILAKFVIGINAGGAAFPASPATGTQFFRTDQRCWYSYDGANWQIVGYEQGGQVTATPNQTISSTTFANITSSTVNVTTLGGGAIELNGHVRTDSNNGAILLRVSINATDASGANAVEEYTLTSDMAIDGRYTFAAAGTYVVMLQMAMNAGATSCRCLNFSYIWRAVRT